MAKTTQTYVRVLLCIVLLMVSLGGCNKGLNNYPETDEEMVDLAKKFQSSLKDRGILEIQIRQDYYVFTFGNDTDDTDDIYHRHIYIVSTDCDRIRDIQTKDFISLDAKNDTSLPDSIKVLVNIAEEAYKHKIRMISVCGDTTVSVERFDDYYISNSPFMKELNGGIEIQPGWYVKRPEPNKN